MLKKTMLSAVSATAALLLAGSIAWGAETAPAKLANTDCIKCHATQPADIAKAGGKHKDAVACIDCHAGHRPSSKNNIPQCTECHSGKPHFDLKGCLGCHTNPHTPKKITFTGKVTDPCLTCHTDQIKQLKGTPSKHTQLACNTCHSTHGLVPQCVQCHKPHSPAMTAADCKKCHKAHMPTALNYGKDVPNQDCAACHQKAFDLLKATKTKHQKVACVTCHEAKHKTVPACQKCHGTPHPAGMLAKFPTCGACHSIAHDLNNFKTEAAPEKKPAPAAAPAKKKK